MRDTDGCGRDGRFTVARRGYDAAEVDEHLRRLEIDMTILGADRDAALEQVAAARAELDETRRELGRLRSQLRGLTVAPESVASMSERLQLMLRLAGDESDAMQAEAELYATNLIAAADEEVQQAVRDADAEFGQFLPPEFLASFATPPPSGPAPAAAEPDERVRQAEQEAERLLRAAAEERARLDEIAIAERARAEEEFRRAVALRCRAVMAQLARLQADNLRTMQQRLADGDEQIRARLDEAGAEVRRLVGEARQEVDELHALRDQLRRQLASVDLTLQRDPERSGSDVPLAVVRPA